MLAHVFLTASLDAVDDVAEVPCADAGQLRDLQSAEAGGTQQLEVGAHDVGVDVGVPAAVGEVAVACAAGLGVEAL